MTNSEHNQNNRIIEEKLDEILVGKVMESNLANEGASFEQILREVDRLSEDPTVKAWMRTENNLIGFTLGAKVSLAFMSKCAPVDLGREIQKFEKAFSIINPSKVNVGRFRRELSRHFFENLEKYWNCDLSIVEEDFLTQTAV